jgi:uncharacterized RDD family membrane protein YckC
MEQILDLPVAEKQHLNYAGFGIRFVAVLIDGILLQIVQVGLSYIIYGSYSFGSESLELTLIGLFLGIAYTVAMQSSRSQATLGKMAVGIKVGDENGNRITAMNALGRYLASILSTLVLCIGYLMVIWDDKKQGLHDKLAGTYVFFGK